MGMSFAEGIPTLRVAAETNKTKRMRFIDARKRCWKRVGKDMEALRNVVFVSKSEVFSAAATGVRAAA